MAPKEPLVGERTRRRGARSALIILGLLAALIPGAPAVALPDIPAQNEVYQYTAPNDRSTGKSLHLDGDYLAMASHVWSELNSAERTSEIVVLRLGADNTVLEKKTVRAPAERMGLGERIYLDHDRGLLIANVSIGQMEIAGEDRDIALLIYRLGGDGEWAIDHVVPVPRSQEVGLYARFSTGFAAQFAVQGDTLVLGDDRAAYKGPGTGVFGLTASGAVLTLDLNTYRLAELFAGTPEAGAGLGSSVSISERFIASSTGSRRYTQAGVTYPDQQVLVWDRANPAAPPVVINSPHPEMTYTEEIYGRPYFGYRVQLDGERLYVSAPDEWNLTSTDPDDPEGGYNESSLEEGSTTHGSIYVLSALTGEQIAPRLLPPPHTSNFGTGLALNGNALMVGSFSTLRDAAGATRTAEGEVYIYDTARVIAAAEPGLEFARRQLVPDQLFKPAVPQQYELFGAEWGGGGISVSGNSAAISSFGFYGEMPDANGNDSYYVGSVYVFRPVIPNVTEIGAQLHAPAIEYGQAGAAYLSVQDATGPGPVDVDYDGEALSGALDMRTRVATIGVPRLLREVGEYPLSAHYLADAGDRFARATGTHLVRRAPTIITPARGVLGPVSDEEK